MPARIINEFAYELSIPVTDIINCSFSQGVVPVQWKQANIVPIPKQFLPTLDKLRPISLTPLLAKVAEGFVCKWVMKAIQPKVDKRQFGNQKGLSTTHCLVDVYNHLVTGASISNNIGSLVLTDFTKAFDSVNHVIAIENLLSLGVSPSIVHWIANFLCDRQQRVTYQQAFSDWQTLTNGVPQGTKLGPVIFLTSINSSADPVYTKCWKYVDDLTLSENRNINTASKIQDDLNNLSDWAVNNKLSLNPSKCQVMQIYLGKKEPPVAEFSVLDVQLQQVQSAKLLGVIFQHNLKWDMHIANTVTKASRKLFMLRKLKKNGLTNDELVTVYKSYIRPIVEYAAPLWHSGISLTLSDQLESIQKRTSRIILGHMYHHYDQALTILEPALHQFCIKSL